jgi:hypothetical protein
MEGEVLDMVKYEKRIRVIERNRMGLFFMLVSGVTGMLCVVVQVQVGQERNIHRDADAADSRCVGGEEWKHYACARLDYHGCKSWQYVQEYDACW